jgi:hypothetical protein
MNEELETESKEQSRKSWRLLTSYAELDKPIKPREFLELKLRVEK